MLTVSQASGCDSAGVGSMGIIPTKEQDLEEAIRARAGRFACREREQVARISRSFERHYSLASISLFEKA